MAPKKAAKKVAGKHAEKHAAKKLAKKAAKKTAKSPGHDLRRAYEHLHRLNIVHGLVAAETLAQVDELSRAAQLALAAEDHRSAADLLRAAEHMIFGTLAQETPDASMSETLMQAASDEYKHLREREEEHHERREDRLPKALRSIRKAMLSSAKTAKRERAYHRALEFARGAEALSHVRAGTLRLRDSAEERRALP